MLALALPAMRALAQAPDPAVLAPIDALFQGMAQRDAAAIKAAAIPGAVLVLMRDGKPEQMTIEAFADRVGKPSKTHIEAHTRSAAARRSRSGDGLGALRGPGRRQTGPLRNRSFQPRPHRRQVADRRNSRHRSQGLCHQLNKPDYARSHRAARWRTLWHPRRFLNLLESYLPEGWVFFAANKAHPPQLRQRSRTVR
jgi:hypothetical protein